MNFRLALLLSLILTLMQGCSENMDQANESTVIKPNDTELLGKLIHLPKTATEIKWEASEDARGGLSSLTAFMKLDESALNEMLSESDKLETSIEESLVSNVLFETWFPSSLKPSLKVEKQGDDILLKEVETLKANYFVIGGMSPFVNGSVLSLEDGFLLIEMYTM